MENIETLIAQARDQAAARQFDAAARLAKRALGLDPDDPAARLAMVFVRYQEKRINPLQKAIASALEVVTDKVERARCHAYMANIYTTYTGPEWWWIHAVEHARRAVAEAPDYAGAHFALALALEKRHRHVAALDAIEVACALDPDPGYLREQTRLRDQLARLSPVAEALAAVESAPTASNWIRVGNLNGYRDQFDEALAAFDRAAAVDPKDKHVKMWRRFWTSVAGHNPVTLTLKTDPKPPKKKPPANKSRKPVKPKQPAKAKKAAKAKKPAKAKKVANKPKRRR